MINGRIEQCLSMSNNLCYHQMFIHLTSNVPYPWQLSKRIKRMSYKGKSNELFSNSKMGMYNDLASSPYFIYKTIFAG